MKKTGRLHEIGVAQMCDKADSKHSHEGESYFDVYERFFNPLRLEPISFLELGVRDGKSMRVWKEYFTHFHANIVGVDINPQCIHQDTSGCKVHIGSQDDAKLLNEISEQVGGWDIIVDDASHLNELTRKSFEILWEHVKPKGLYIIEDLRPSYSDLSHLPSHWNFVDLHPEKQSMVNDRKVLNDLFFGLIADLDVPRGNIRSIQFYHQMVIIEKV